VIKFVLIVIAFVALVVAAGRLATGDVTTAEVVGGVGIVAGIGSFFAGRK
jgi:hypothetical protein